MRVFSDRHAMLASIPKGGLSVEVGVLRGEFSRAIRDVQQPDQLVLIDTWNDYQGHGGDESLAIVTSMFADDWRVILRRCCSEKGIAEIPNGSIGFAYVDGDHSYEAVLRDLEALLPKMQPGGWLCGHDYCMCNDFGVVRAVSVFCHVHGLEVDAMTDEPLAEWLNPRVNEPPQISYNSFGIRIPG